MNPLSFVKSLLPSFTRTTVLEDVRLTKHEITTVTQPAYEQALRIFGNRKFLSPDLQADFELYKRTAKPSASANTVVAVEKSIKQVLDTLSFVEKLVEKEYGEEIAGSGMTFHKTAALQLIESVAFVSKYARRYLNYVLVVETSYVDDEKGNMLAQELGAALVPAEVRYLKENFLQFANTMATLTKPVAQIEKDFDKIPDVAVTDESTAMMKHTLGESRLDPFLHGLVPIWMNPIYHIRMGIAEWQVNRLKEAQEEMKLLQLRKLKMERALANKPNDASLEKQIEYTQGRIENLSEEIRQKEKAYA